MFSGKKHRCCQLRFRQHHVVEVLFSRRNLKLVKINGKIENHIEEQVERDWSLEDRLTLYHINLRFVEGFENQISYMFSI